MREILRSNEFGYSFTATKDVVILCDMFDMLHKLFIFKTNSQTTGALEMVLKTFIRNSADLNKDADVALALLARFAEMDAFFSQYSQFVEKHMDNLNDATEKAMLA